MRLGIGDDAAAWSSDAGVSVATTDTLVEGVHFRLEWTGWRDLGWKSMVASLSDVAAMGCSPTAGMVTLGLRSDHEVDDVLELYRGMLDACDRSGGAIVGGGRGQIAGPLRDGRDERDGADGSQPGCPAADP